MSMQPQTAVRLDTPFGDISKIACMTSLDSGRERVNDRINRVSKNHRANHSGK